MNSQSVGVLTKDDIVQEIKAGRLVNGPVDQARGCSYDLTVGTIFWDEQIFRSGEAKTVCVPPGGVVGIFTAEEISLPADICATAFAINAMSSRGFLVLNPGHIDPGFEGPLTIKALNIRKTAIAIHQTDPIFTVVFQRLPKPTILFQRNKSRAEREREFDATTVETSPRSISDIVAADAKGPFPSRVEVSTVIKQETSDLTTKHDVEVIIRDFWMSRWSFGLALLAVLLAAAAAYFSFAQLRLSNADIAARETGRASQSAPAALRGHEEAFSDSGGRYRSAQETPSTITKILPSKDAQKAGRPDGN